MNPQVLQILDTVPIGVLATINPNGIPWATAIHLTHDEQYIYWFSKDKATHSLNIQNQAAVSLSIWSPDKSHGLTGVYLQSQAEKTQDRKAAEEAYIAKFGELPESFSPFSVYRAPLGHIDHVKSNGQLWYLSHT